MDKTLIRVHDYIQNDTIRTPLGSLVGAQIEINDFDKVSSLRFASLFSQNLKYKSSGACNSL